MVITMAKLRMEHASTHGTRKPPGQKVIISGRMPRLTMSNSLQTS